MLGVIAIIASVIGGIILWRGFKSSIFKSIFDNLNAEDLRFTETDDKVDNRVLLRSFETYVSAIKTMTPKRLHNVTSDSMYHTTLTNVEGMSRIGVRREIEYVPTGVMEPGPIMDDGKVKTCTLHIPCKYTERLIDNTTNSALDTKHMEKATILIWLTRNPERQPGDEINCLGCGMPIGTNGELFICEYCDATYTSDSYDWSISSIEVTKGEGLMLEEGRQANPVIQSMSYIYLVLMVLVPILGFIAGGSPGLAAVVWIGIILVIGYSFVFSYLILPHMFKGFCEIKKIDPLSSMKQVYDRMQYLLSVYFNGMNFNPSTLKPFMEPSIYNEIMQNYKPSGNYVLQIEGGGWGIVSGIVGHGGKTYITYTINMVLSVFDSNRRFEKVKKKLVFQMCRGENVVTAHKGAASALVCSGCGRTINLTADGECTYCGTEYDLSQVDWILGRVSDDMFV